LIRDSSIDDVRFSVRSFGPSVTGCEVWAFTFADLISDVLRLLEMDVREVASMICVARIDPTLVASMGHLVKGALEYIKTAISNMTPAERSALPKSVQFPLPTADDVTKIR
jgi:hypothetical protein